MPRIALLIAIFLVGTTTGCGSPWLAGLAGHSLPGCASGDEWYEEETCAGLSDEFSAAAASSRCFPDDSGECGVHAGGCDRCRSGGRGGCGPLSDRPSLRTGMPGGGPIARLRERMLAASQEPLVPNPTPPPPARFHPVPTRPVFEPCDVGLLPTAAYEPLPTPAN